MFVVTEFYGWWLNSPITSHSRIHATGHKTPLICLYSNLELQFGGGGIQRGARHLNGLSVVVIPLLKWYPVNEKVERFFKQELFYNYCSVTPEHTWFKSLVMISMSSSLINYNNVLDILSKWYNIFYFM